MTPNAIFGVDDYQNLSLGVAPKINAGQQFSHPSHPHYES